MSKGSVLGGDIQALGGPLPHVEYRWDPETEILSGVAEVEGGRGLTGTIELEDGAGAVVTLDFTGGVMRGIEIVVWPESLTTPGLSAPEPSRTGQLVIPGRPSQPGVAVLEVDVVLTAERSEGESVIHVGIGDRRGAEHVALADNLLIALDASGQLAGFWLTQVPPFPESAAG